MSNRCDMFIPLRKATQKSRMIVPVAKTEQRALAGKKENEQKERKERKERRKEGKKKRRKEGKKERGEEGKRERGKEEKGKKEGTHY